MAKIPKNEQKRPKMALKVEPNFSLFLTQKPYNKKQLHVNKQRTIKKVKEYFYTFQYLYQSELLEQAYKDKLFPEKMIRDFLRNFTSYDYNHTDLEEQVKQQISTNALRDSLSYIESRFKNIQLVQKQLIEFKELLNMIEELSITKVEERNAIEFYKIRSLRTLPPDLQAQESLYVVMCRICWNHYSGLDKIQAIKHIRHLKNCLYDESEMLRCIEVIPPKNLKGKS